MCVCVVCVCVCDCVGVVYAGSGDPTDRLPTVISELHFRERHLAQLFL